MGFCLFVQKQKERELINNPAKRNAKEGALVDGIDVIGVENLREVIEFFNNKN